VERQERFTEERRRWILGQGGFEMRGSLQIKGTGVELTEAIRAAVRERAEKLDRIYDNVISCSVAIESPRRRYAKGTFYNVHIDLTIPGKEIVVKREPDEDLYVAIGEAFDAAQRQMQEFVEKRKGKLKQHEGTPVGTVYRLFPGRKYGFIITADGREVYFNANSVLNSHFKELKLGDQVRFVEEMGDQGPQASTVRL
jgi:ribosomal subunit interface protein